MRLQCQILQPLPALQLPLTAGQRLFGASDDTHDGGVLLMPGIQPYTYPPT